MKELKKRVLEFNKIAKEGYARMQQLGVSYQDIGHILGRYYDLKKPKGLGQHYQPPTDTGKQPLQQEAGIGSQVPSMPSLSELKKKK